jgi:hypothetical protein
MLSALVKEMVVQDDKQCCVIFGFFWSSYIDLPPRHRDFSPLSFCCHLLRALTDRYCYSLTTSHSPVSQLSIRRQSVATSPFAKHLKFPRISLCHRQNIVIFSLCNTWIGAISPSPSTGVKCDAVHSGFIG